MFLLNLRKRTTGGVHIQSILLCYEYDFASSVNAGDSRQWQLRCKQLCISVLELYSCLIKSKQFGSHIPTYARIKEALLLLIQHEAGNHRWTLLWLQESWSKTENKEICYFWRRLRGYAFRLILQLRKLFPNHPVPSYHVSGRVNCVRVVWMGVCDWIIDPFCGCENHPLSRGEDKASESIHNAVISLSAHHGAA